MSDTAVAATKPPRGRLRRFVSLAGPFLVRRGPNGGRSLTLAVLGLTLVQIGFQVLFNLWNRDFFNALEARDRTAFLWQMGLFVFLAVGSMGASIYQLYAKQLLELRWRAWLTRRLVAMWLEDGRHYQLGLVDTGADNPDQRIAEDARLATEHAVELATGLFNAVLMLIIFIGILWTVSGSLFVPIGERTIEIPGYMVFAALFYAFVGSGLTYLFGRPLVDLNATKAGKEADFRFGLLRLRESSEGIALIKGERDEARGLAVTFKGVALAVRDVMRAQRRLMWLTSGYGMLAMVFPTLVASPQYFAGVITLGGMMQIVSAFQSVQGALSWTVDNFPRIAEWRASAGRVLVLDEAIETLADTINDPEQATITLAEGDGQALVFEHVSVTQADGPTVIGDATAEVKAGEKVLIVGESGTGKSTLFRAMAGAWPWGAGTITMPPRRMIQFMPQRPYLPLGKLRGAISYPAGETAFEQAVLDGALKRVGLERLIARLDEEDRWDRVLSLGEQQRLGFARLLLHKPEWVFMDEATSALDEEAQASMMDLFREDLASSALVSIGHRPGLEAWHDRTLTLVRNPDGARLVAKRAQKRKPRLPVDPDNVPSFQTGRR